MHAAPSEDSKSESQQSAGAKPNCPFFLPCLPRPRSALMTPAVGFSKGHQRQMRKAFAAKIRPDLCPSAHKRVVRRALVVCVRRIHLSDPHRHLEDCSWERGGPDHLMTAGPHLTSGVTRSKLKIASWRRQGQSLFDPARPVPL